MNKRRRILIVVVALAIFSLISGWMYFFTGNKQLLDTTNNFDRAVLSLPDGTVVSGKVESWRDYDDGDQIQVRIDGTTYLVHSSNIVLIHE